MVTIAVLVRSLILAQLRGSECDKYLPMEHKQENRMQTENIYIPIEYKIPA